MAVWQYNVFFIPFINFDENYLEFIKQPDTEFLKNRHGSLNFHFKLYDKSTQLQNLR